LSNLYAGKYEGQIADNLSCIQNISYQLKERDSLFLRLAITENDCVQNANLNLVNPNGGVPPYSISINGIPFGEEAEGITLQPGQYNVIVLDNNGCEITDDFSLENAIECDVIIPNIISPNSNSPNGYFSVFVSENFNGTFESLKIYDRWGNLVYILDEFMPNEKLWDGTFHGKAVEQGVYTYIIEYIVNEIGSKVISGDVTVIR
jgi:large repetitive protein